MAKKPFTPIPPMAELPPAEEINVKEILDKYLAGEIDLICVLGPTASGKTRYAVHLARQINHLLARYAMKKQAECSDQGQYNDQVSCLSNAPWAVSASEKRATPLAAGGGTREVGGVVSGTTVSGSLPEFGDNPILDHQIRILDALHLLHLLALQLQDSLRQYPRQCPYIVYYCLHIAPKKVNLLYISTLPVLRAPQSEARRTDNSLLVNYLEYFKNSTDASMSGCI